jgi:chemotaxis protein CheZ
MTERALKAPVLERFRSREDHSPHRQVDPGTANTPLTREIGIAADYMRFLRQELSRLGPNEIAKDRLPAAARELGWIIQETGLSTNTIMTAAEEVMAAADMEAEAYRAFVADKMTAIFVACAFQDLAAQRGKRVQATLSTVERRMSRLATALGTRDVPDLVDFAAPPPVAPEPVGLGPSAPGQGNSQTQIDEIFEEWNGIEWG